MYCSLTAIDHHPVDPKVLSYEKQTIQFDNRPWKAAWSEKTNYITTIEYLPAGEDINLWNELITTQFMPGLEKVSVKEFGNRFFNGLKKSGVIYTVDILANKPDLLMFEFRVEQPSNLQQDEIQKIVKTKEGLYAIHYAIKKLDMGKENRQKWIEHIKNSSLKNQSVQE
jgi:hypothetical protein